MKLKTTITALLLAGSVFGFAGSAFGQACGTLTGSIPGGNPPASVAGNNCTNNTNFTAICANSETLGGGGMDIYQLAVGATNNFTISIQSSAFTPELGFIATTCSSSTNCIVDATIAAPGTVTSPTQTGLAAGNYYIFVANVTDAACGAYNLSFTGSTPVKLQNFSVQ